MTDPARSVWQPSQKHIFWWLFWATIILLAALVGFAKWTEVQQIGRFKIDSTGRIAPLEQYITEIDKALQEFDKMKRAEIDEKARAKINGLIESTIKDAFVPVYGQIDSLADFHYSVIGEYTELIAVLGNRGGQQLQKILFEQVGFDERLNRAASAINSGVVETIGQAMSKLQNSLQTELRFSVEESKLLTNVFQLTVESVNTRFSGELLALRAGGAGVAAAITAGSLAGKKAATSIATKVAAKASAKAAAKVAANNATAITSGLVATGLCIVLGPLAPVCGIVTAVIVWFSMDYVIVKLDEAMHRTEFKADIRRLIDDQKASITAQLQGNYEKILTGISKGIDDKVNMLKPGAIRYNTPAQAVTGR